MQDLNLIRVLRRVDSDGKAIFDYILNATKDNGQRVETEIKHENYGVLKDLNDIVESFITKEDELEILKKTVEYMSVSKAKEVNTGNAELDLPPALELPKTDKIETPATPDLPNGVNLPELEKEVLSKVEENKEVE